MTANPFTAKALGQTVEKPKLKAFGAKPTPKPKKKMRSFGSAFSDPRKREVEAAHTFATAAAQRHEEATKMESKLFKIVDKLEAKRGTDKFDAAYKAWSDAAKETDRTYINLHQAIVRERTVLKEIENH